MRPVGGCVGGSRASSDAPVKFLNRPPEVLATATARLSQRRRSSFEASASLRHLRMTVLASVIASQRIRAKRAPMTGSAKQSRATQTTLDCFRLRASASADAVVASLLAVTADMPHPSRGAFRPSYVRHFALIEKRRAQGRPGARCTREPSREKIARKREDHRYRRNHTGLPCAVVYGLYVISSVNLADCHRPPRCACASSALAPAFGAPGPHDFARPPRVPLVSQLPRVHRNPPRAS